MASLKTLKGQVELTLANYKTARNSDIELTRMIWQNYCPNKVFNNAQGKASIELVDLFELPREDHISRIRRKIQNEEGLYLPDIWEVAKIRGIEENKWRVFMGYPPLFNPNQTKLI